MTGGRRPLRRRLSVANRHDHLTVMLVDDHAVVRSGLRNLLEANGMKVVAEAATAEEAVTQARKHKPAVVVMDVRLGGASGIEATREIRSRWPKTHVLMLTSFPDDEALVASMLAGASAYVLKEVRAGEIVRTMRAVAAGENLIDASLSAEILDRVRRGKRLLGARLALLSPQEERVLEHVAKGQTNAEIARDLDLSEKTVKNYVSNVLMKLEVGRRAEAAAYLARHTAPAG